LELSDEQLVVETLNGCEQSYAELMHRYQSNVMGLAQRALGDRSLAEDVAQEVFLRAYRALRQFETNRAFGPWLLTIARNRIRDHIRLKTRRKEVFWETETTPLLSENVVHDRTVSKQIWNRIETGIHSMPKETAEVLKLRFVHHLEYEEIAHQLDLPIGTVKSRISRARVVLRELLEENI